MEERSPGGEGDKEGGGGRATGAEGHSLCAAERVDDDVVDLVAPHQHVLPVQGALPLVGLAQPEVWGGVEKFGGWEV